MERWADMVAHSAGTAVDSHNPAASLVGNLVARVEADTRVAAAGSLEADRNPVGYWAGKPEVVRNQAACSVGRLVADRNQEAYSVDSWAVDHSPAAYSAGRSGVDHIREACSAAGTEEASSVAELWEEELSAEVSSPAAES